MGPEGQGDCLLSPSQAVDAPTLSACAHLGVELRDVGPPLREVEELEGRNGGKAHRLLWPLLEIPPTHELGSQTYTLSNGNPTIGSQDGRWGGECQGGGKSIDSQPLPSVSARPELKTRTGWNLSRVPYSVSAFSRFHSQVDFRSSPLEDAMALRSDPLQQRMPPVLVGLSDP